jgi:hypothetical protein
MKTLKLTLLSVALSLTAFAQTIVTKEATGEAAVIAKDELKAFEDAKQNALRAACEAAAGVRIEADTVVVNNQLVRDQVFANTSGYVKKFDVVSKKVEKGVMTVTVKADVITDDLDKDIQAARDLVKRNGRPSIVIVVQEQTIPIGGKATINSESIATVLTEALKADGWDIKDMHGINKTLKLEGGVTLGATEFKTIGDTTKAAYVLYGKAAVRHQESDSGLLKNATSFYPVSGEYDLAMFASDTGDQIIKLNGKLIAHPQSPTPVVSYERSTFELIKGRKDEIIAPMRKGILEHLRNTQVNGMRLEMSVAGLDSFGAAKDFKKSIESMKGIKEATQGSFANGKAEYKITYLGSATDFADVIEASTFKKKKLNIIAVSSTKLEVQVAK